MSTDDRRDEDQGLPTRGGANPFEYWRTAEGEQPAERRAQEPAELPVGEPVERLAQERAERRADRHARSRRSASHWPDEHLSGAPTPAEQSRSRVVAVAVLLLVAAVVAVVGATGLAGDRAGTRSTVPFSILPLTPGHLQEQEPSTDTSFRTTDPTISWRISPESARL